MMEPFLWECPVCYAFNDNKRTVCRRCSRSKPASSSSSEKATTTEASAATPDRVVTLVMPFSPGGEPFTDRLEDGNIHPREAEAYVAGLWHMALAFGVMDHGKMYDPLVIDEETNTAHTYMFDLWDGGRHHEYVTLKDVCSWARWEAICRVFFENADPLPKGVDSLRPHHAEPYNPHTDWLFSAPICKECAHKRQGPLCAECAARREKAAQTTTAAATTGEGDVSGSQLLQDHTSPKEDASTYKGEEK